MILLIQGLEDVDYKSKAGKDVSGLTVYGVITEEDDPRPKLVGQRTFEQFFSGKRSCDYETGQEYELKFVIKKFNGEYRAYPDDPIVYNSYLPKSSASWDVTATDVTYMDGIVYLQLNKSVTWLQGYEYTFYLRFSAYGLSESGTRIETELNYIDVLGNGEYMSTKTVSTVEG